MSIISLLNSTQPSPTFILPVHYCSGCCLTISLTTLWVCICSVLLGLKTAVDFTLLFWRFGWCAELHLYHWWRCATWLWPSFLVDKLVAMSRSVNLTRIGTEIAVFSLPLASMTCPILCVGAFEWMIAERPFVDRTKTNVSDFDAITVCRATFFVPTHWFWHNSDVCSSSFAPLLLLLAL